MRNINIHEDTLKKAEIMINLSHEKYHDDKVRRNLLCSYET